MIKLPVLQSQQDSRWGSILLGNNKLQPYNIYNYGCLLTCFSMSLCYYGENYTPDTLNTALIAKGGFTKDDGNYIWTAIQKITTKLKDKHVAVGDINPVSDAQMAEIKDALDKGMPVAFHIDYNPKTVKDDQHWVLGVGYNPADENDFTIIDPIDGKQKSLKAYLGWFRPSMRKTVIDYVIMSGNPVASAVMGDTEINFNDAEGKRHTVAWYVYEWFEEKKKAIGANNNYETLSGIYKSYKKNTEEALINANKQVVELTKLSKEQAEKIIQLENEKDLTVSTCIGLLVSAFQKWVESVLKGGAK